MNGVVKIIPPTRNSECKCSGNWVVPLCDGTMRRPSLQILGFSRGYCLVRVSRSRRVHTQRLICIQALKLWTLWVKTSRQCIEIKRGVTWALLGSLNWDILPDLLILSFLFTIIYLLYIQLLLYDLSFYNFLIFIINMTGSLLLSWVSWTSGWILISICNVQESTHALFISIISSIFAQLSFVFFNKCVYEREAVSNPQFYCCFHGGTHFIKCICNFIFSGFSRVGVNFSSKPVEGVLM